jgi:hypothetical protein
LLVFEVHALPFSALFLEPRMLTLHYLDNWNREGNGKLATRQQ